MMPPLAFNRLTLLGLLLLLPGLYFGIRFTSGFFRMVYRKLRRGRPYLKGSASDYFLFACGALAVAVLGAALTLASWLQGGLQAYTGPEEVGTVHAQRNSGGKIVLALNLVNGYPGEQSRLLEVEGTRWALEGAFLSWRFRAAWLGFKDGHRLEKVLGASRREGAPDRTRETWEEFSGAYPPWTIVHRHPVPLLKTSRRQTPWMPADGGTYRIWASPTGYILVEEGKAVSESSS